MTTGMMSPAWLCVCALNCLAEVHDVDPGLAEGGADGRRRRGRSGRDLELDDLVQYFCRHLSLLLPSRDGPAPRFTRPVRVALRSAPSSETSRRLYPAAALRPSGA